MKGWRIIAVAALTAPVLLVKAAGGSCDSISAVFPGDRAGMDLDLFARPLRAARLLRAEVWRNTMRNRSSIILILAFGFGIISLPLLAHHGNAAYDYEKTVTIKGVVTAWVFANPHSLMKIDVTDDKGEAQHWVLEGNPPSASDAGWHKTTLKVGDVIVVDVMPPKNGTLIGRIRRILSPDGTVLLDAHLPSTLNDVAPPKNAPKPTADSNSDGSR
jgi:hypothetical protein